MELSILLITPLQEDFEGEEINLDIEAQSVNKGIATAFGARNNINGVNLSYSYENTDFVITRFQMVVSCIQKKNIMMTMTNMRVKKSIMMSTKKRTR